MSTNVAVDAATNQLPQTNVYVCLTLAVVLQHVQPALNTLD